MLPESGVSDGTLHSRQLSQWASGNRHLGDPSLATAPGAAAFPPSSSLAPAVAARRCQQDSEVEAGAVQAYHLGASQRPLSSEERNDLGNALREAGRGEEAVAQYVACLHLLISEAAQAEAQGLGTHTHARRQVSGGCGVVSCGLPVVCMAGSLWHQCGWQTAHCSVAPCPIHPTG